MVTMTSSATEKVQDFIQEYGVEGDVGLRVAVLPGGCSGFQYGLNVEDGPEADDEVLNVNGVKDPELDLDLVVLGLVYDIEVDGGDVHVVMSLTSPMCPVAEQLVLDAQAAVEGVEGVESCEVDLTFDPPWTPERISPLIRASLGL